MIPLMREFPQAPDAEKGVLCSCLIVPDCIGMLVEKGFEPEALYIPAHQELFRALCELVNTGKPVNFVTVAQLLKDKNTLDQCGGGAYITELWGFIGTAGQVWHFADIVNAKWTARKLIAVCNEYASRGYEEADIAGVLEAFEVAALKVRPADSAGIPAMRECVMQAVSDVQRLYDTRGAIAGLATGLAGLDRMIDGLKGADLFIIAARPSMGKTALLMNIAEFIAVDLAKPVGVFSLEMSRQQLVQRKLLSRARVNMANVRNGFLTDRDFPNIMRAAGELAPAGIWIDDESSLSIAKIRARARRWRKEKGIAAVFVDYLQLCTSPTKQGTFSRETEISQISQGLKAMAKELDIPVIAAAQLNRKSEDRKGGKPRMADLRESGSIEQDADIVGLLHREEYYAEDDKAKEEAVGKATLDIAKQRNGPVGEIPLTFLREYTRFEDRATTTEQEPRQYAD